mgnify:CR=1 FL=1
MIMLVFFFLPYFFFQTQKKKKNTKFIVAIMSQRTGVSVIDGTKTISAVHQNDENGDFSGDRKSRPSEDRNYNLKVSFFFFFLWRKKNSNI